MKNPPDNSETRLREIRAHAVYYARRMKLREPDDFIQDCLRRALEHPDWDRVQLHALDWLVKQVRDLQRGDTYGKGGDRAREDSEEHDYDGPASLEEARERLCTAVRGGHRGCARHRLCALARGDLEVYRGLLELLSPNSARSARSRDIGALARYARGDTEERVVAEVAARVLVFHRSFDDSRRSVETEE